jgi:hypothetical protein
MINGAPAGRGTAGFEIFLQRVRRLPRRSMVVIDWHGPRLYRAHWLGFPRWAEPRPPYSNVQYQQLKAIAGAHALHIKMRHFWQPRYGGAFKWIDNDARREATSVPSRRAYLSWLRGMWKQIRRRIDTRRNLRWRPSRIVLPARLVALALASFPWKPREQRWVLAFIGRRSQTRSRFGRALRQAAVLNLGGSRLLLGVFERNPPSRLGPFGVEAVLFDTELSAWNGGRGRYGPLPMLFRAYCHAKGPESRRIIAVILSRSFRAWGAPAVRQERSPAERQRRVVQFCHRFFVRNRCRIWFNPRYYQTFLRAPNGRFLHRFRSQGLVFLWPD